MLDADKLQKMKDNHILSEEEFVDQKHRLASKILRKENRRSVRSGIIYIILAFFVGAVGIHNIYARYWKRGLIQFFLAVIAPYMLFIPLMFTSIWAMMELMFVNKGPDGVLFSGNRKIILLLRALSIVVLAWFFSASDTVLQDMNWEIIGEN